MSAALLLPGEILSLPAEAADRLTGENSGDAALLYLALLRAGGDVRRAGLALKWTPPRLEGALACLTRLGLARQEACPPLAPAPAADRDEPPDYLRSDVLRALECEEDFRGLYQAVQVRLGKPLSDSDLKALYTIYDYLALPADVILMLTAWCVEEHERKYGPGRRPRMQHIKKTAFRWKREGVDTAGAAEAYLLRQQGFRRREAALLPLLGIRDRLPLDREREYIDGWIDMGFDDQAIALAYERTILKKQSLNWAYMNSILKSWHSKGLHTPEAISAGDRPQGDRPAGQSPVQPQNRHKNDGRLEQELAWMDRFLAQSDQSDQTR